MAPLLVSRYVRFILDMLFFQRQQDVALPPELVGISMEAMGGSRRPTVAHDVCCATQKEESQAKAKKAAEAEEAQKKLADIMVEAQKKVGLWVAP